MFVCRIWIGDKWVSGNEDVPKRSSLSFAADIRKAHYDELDKRLLVARRICTLRVL